MFVVQTTRWPGGRTSGAGSGAVHTLQTVEQTDIVQAELWIASHILL